MHVIIGGAYNGKRKYAIEQLGNRPYEIYEGEIPAGPFSKQEHIIITDFEKLVLSYRNHDELEIAEMIVRSLKQLHRQTNVICICNDVGRGIVPIEKEQRFIRDACGRVYQRLFEEADAVTRVWYGIPEVIKKGTDTVL
ncbi:MAG: bifunctional adenosylcobinamide kinase/adenosylcobinamide-phosphate guanylyltransferase [Lysinibacillus sp.]